MLQKHFLSNSWYNTCDKHQPYAKRMITALNCFHDKFSLGSTLFIRSSIHPLGQLIVFFGWLGFYNKVLPRSENRRWNRTFYLVWIFSEPICVQVNIPAFICSFINDQSVHRAWLLPRKVPQRYFWYFVFSKKKFLTIVNFRKVNATKFPFITSLLTEFASGGNRRTTSTENREIFRVGEVVSFEEAVFYKWL